MPTYRKTREAVAKLTPEQDRVSQTDRTEGPLRQRILGQQEARSLRRRGFRRVAFHMLRQVRQRNRIGDFHGNACDRPPEVDFTPFVKPSSAHCVRRFSVLSRRDS
jgi:hypothetical protein